MPTPPRSARPRNDHRVPRVSLAAVGIRVAVVLAGNADARPQPQRAPTEEGRVEPLPRYPSVTRDLSILIDETLAAAAVRATIRDAAPPTLVQVREFDRYQGKGVPEGKVSLSLRLSFRASDRTLTDTEVQSAMEAIIAAVIQRHGALQR